MRDKCENVLGLRYSFVIIQFSLNYIWDYRLLKQYLIKKKTRNQSVIFTVCENCRSIFRKYFHSNACFFGNFRIFLLECVPKSRKTSIQNIYAELTGNRVLMDIILDREKETQLNCIYLKKINKIDLTLLIVIDYRFSWWWLRWNR